MPKPSTLINTVLWDLDGTLVDSEHIHDEAAVYACEVMHLKFDINTLAPGQDAITVFEIIMGEPLNAKLRPIFDKWHEITIQYTLKNFHKARQIDQSIELVHEFASSGLQQSIVSNTSSSIIHQCVNKLKIANYLSNFIGRDKVNSGKPSPEPYLHAIRLHNTKAENCLVFEDSHTGIRSALNAGIKVVGIRHNNEDFPPAIDHICSLTEKSWLKIIKAKYL